jgi:hypothetical protein
MAAGTTEVAPFPKCPDLTVGVLKVKAGGQECPPHMVCGSHGNTKSLHFASAGMTEFFPRSLRKGGRRESKGNDRLVDVSDSGARRFRHD